MLLQLLASVCAHTPPHPHPHTHMRASDIQGHTRMMNLFSVGQRLVLVDLPGYGFRGREDWMGMIDEYFSSRRTYVCLRSMWWR